MTRELLIDCDSCVMRLSSICEDCVVTAILDRPEGAIVFDAAEERAVRALGRAGLLPSMHFQEVAGGP